MDADTLSSRRVCAETGLSYRQLDYLTRTGVVGPIVDAQGSGSQRRWGREQVRVLRAVKRLLEHGARGSTLRVAVSEIEALDPPAWDHRVMITREGRVAPLLGPDPHGWILDLGHCRDAA